MDQNALKKQVAEAALRYVPEGEVVGVGTGSTANFFIGEQFATILERLGATGTVQNGILRHEDFFARTQALTIQGGGSIDLARQQLDYGLNINVNDGDLLVPIRIVGSWDIQLYSV